MRRRWWAGAVAVVAMVTSAGCADGDPSARPDAPTSTSTGTSTSTSSGTSDPAPDAPIDGEEDGDEDGVVPEGFARVAATVVTAEGEECEVCLWLAGTAAQRRLGLMGVTDLGNADGMAFVYPGPHTGSFWMKNTLLPLSIAFFDSDGRFLDAFDMEPCVDDPCVQYPTPRDFLVAVEVVQGGLDALGIGPGSVLRRSDLPCG